MERYFNWQPTCKPGFVEDDHLSTSTIADTLKRVSTSERTTRLC